jgi:hypothetical protein
MYDVSEGQRAEKKKPLGAYQGARMDQGIPAVSVASAIQATVVV